MNLRSCTQVKESIDREDSSTEERHRVGRPPKYMNAEERRQAKNLQRRESYKRTKLATNQKDRNRRPPKYANAEEWRQARGFQRRENYKRKKSAEFTTDQKDQNRKPSSQPARADLALPSPASSPPSYLHSTQQWRIRNLETELTRWKERSKSNQEYAETLEKEIDSMNREIQHLRSTLQGHGEVVD